jgi:hypothetical protein
VISHHGYLSNFRVHRPVMVADHRSALGNYFGSVVGCVLRFLVDEHNHCLESRRC